MERTAENDPLTKSTGQSGLFSCDVDGERKRPDPLRRFTFTPHVINLQLMQRTVRLETNNPIMLELALNFFERHQQGPTQPPEFLWRLVCERDPQVPSTALPLVAFSDPGLRYVNIGQRGFLAVDLEKREAVSFLAEQFVEGGPRLRHRPPIDILFCMTAASLGLTALLAGCVGLKDRGVVIFGPPNSGKTTASYLAARLGMEFHADQVVFLDMKGGLLRAWGDPFPAVFRPETLHFLPELREASRRSSYADLSFYYFDKSPLQAPRAQPVVPACSVFLDRQTDTREPRLRLIDRTDTVSRLRDCMLFKEDKRFDAQVAAALSALGGIPAYDFQYGIDPKIAATFIEKMLR
jgi:hypothetical protein